MCSKSFIQSVAESMSTNRLSSRVSRQQTGKELQLTDDTDFHIHRRFAPVRGMALQTQLPGCLHGVHGQVLDPGTQHT
jgi:hypothetical protein